MNKFNEKNGKIEIQLSFEKEELEGLLRGIVQARQARLYGTLSDLDNDNDKYDLYQLELLEDNLREHNI